MSSHALLLRLFLSSSFFSVHVALKYLLFYADNIGITYYLTRRLRELDINELRDVWGFICHLLVTRPSKSRALECFVVEIAQKSTHIALITLWFMQATLSDLSMQRDSQSFAICQRVLHKCHEIVFGDQLLPSSSPYSGFNLPAFTRRRKVNHHAEPIFVGLGVLLASAPAMPQLVDITGQIAIEQGRAEDEGVVVRGFQPIHDEELYSASSGYTPTDETDDHDMSSGPDEDFPSPLPPKIVESTNIRSLGRRRTLGAQTLPALPLHLQTIRKPRLSESDPLGQLDSESSGTPYQSSPSLPSARTPSRVAAANKANLILEKYDDQAQMHLLRGHYYISEVQFLLSLENICNRLVIVPKPARVSALRAELTALNHKLPAEVCMPMWCSSVDSAAGRKFPTPHHRIVRIPPGEAVVLNSAERAPYLLLIEILSDDLDFDSSKRANKDILRKLVTKKVEQRDGWTNFGLSSSNFWKDTLPDSGGASTSLLPPSADPTTAGPSSTALTNDDEEIDLVEQLYGDDQPLRSRVLDIEDSIVLPPTPKNKELDMATWARSSPHISQHFDELRLGLGMPGGQHFSTYSMSRTNSISPSNSQMSHGQSEPIHMISLDEYSERMRTAAIMLAQLNADQGREQVPSTPKLNGASRSDNLLDRSGRQSGPGTSGEVPQPMASRMKLPRAEAHAIRDRIMKEMLSLEEERMERMKGSDSDTLIRTSVASGSSKSAEDEGIIRRELNKVDPSAVVFSESWAAKKSRIRHGSPYGHLANWECVSVIVKTGGDLRQEQLAVQLIREFQQIWTEEKCSCWVKYFRILITGSQSGLVETITDAVSIHSIKKAEYAKRLASGRLGHVTLMDHFISTYGEPSSAKFARAQKNFAKSLAGYSIVTYLLQVKDRHNGNILIDRDGHLIHIDFGFILSNTPGNIGFEAAPFKFPPEYVEVLGGITGPAFLEFKKLFREGFEAARKHCDRIITLVELMQKDSMLPCFAVSGVQTANQLRERFQSTLTHALVGDYVNRLIDSSLGSHWTRLYDSYQYYSQSIL